MTTKAPSIATLVPSAVYMCKNDPALLQLARDGILGYDQDGLWVMQGKPEDPSIGDRDAQGTGMCAVVLSADSSWSSGNAHNTAKFPFLQVLVYADATRNAQNEQVKQDQRAKAWRVWEALDDLFHDPANLRHDWFGTRVDASRRGTGPLIQPVPNTDGLIRVRTLYEISI